MTIEWIETIFVGWLVLSGLILGFLCFGACFERLVESLARFADSRHWL